jgi:hypothetical protein
MRKLSMAGVIAAAALFAQGAWADDAAKERREAADATRAEMRQDAREARDETKQEAREAREEMRQEGREARESMGSAADRTEQRAQAGMRDQEKKHPIFDGKDNFEVEGKIQKASKNSITVTRDELPAATLSVSQHTKIELDGDQVSVSQLKPGQDVKASFNLRGDKAEAVEIKAEKMD